jgi:hypothetical protein
VVVRVEFRVTGAAEVERAMKELGAQAANRIARSALNRAGTPVVKTARSLVPIDTGARMLRIACEHLPVAVPGGGRAVQLDPRLRVEARVGELDRDSPP